MFIIMMIRIVQKDSSCKANYYGWHELIRKYLYFSCIDLKADKLIVSLEI